MADTPTHNSEMNAVHSRACGLIPPRADAQAFLRAHGLAAAHQPLWLHLGCGETHLDGYVNIDYPPSQHTVMQQLAADVYAEIRELKFPEASVDEIRLHHVFEHFDRQTALGLLCNWQRWLKVGGRLWIETPDFEAGARRMLSMRGYDDQQVVMRHLYGSHEAPWAAHWDGWYEAKFRRVLERLGFEQLVFEHSHWSIIDNISVRASKGRQMDVAELRQEALALLRSSMVDGSESEERMWRVWARGLDEVIGLASDAPVPVFPARVGRQSANSLVRRLKDRLRASRFLRSIVAWLRKL